MGHVAENEGGKHKIEHAFNYSKVQLTFLLIVVPQVCLLYHFYVCNKDVCQPQFMLRRLAPFN